MLEKGVRYQAPEELANSIIHGVGLVLSIAVLAVTFIGDGLNDAPATILGRPVLEQNDIPTNLGAGTDESEVFLGDLSYYLIGDRQSMETETSTEAGDAFVNHQLWMKVVERLDGQLSQTEAFHLLTGVK